MEMERRGEEVEMKPPATASPTWDCGSPLYDAFELASVYRVLDGHLMALPFARRSPEADVAVASSRRTTSSAVARRRSRSRRAVAKAARRTGKAVLRSICRTVTCSRKL